MCLKIFHIENSIWSSLVYFLNINARTVNSKNGVVLYGSPAFKTLITTFNNIRVMRKKSLLDKSNKNHIDSTSSLIMINITIRFLVSYDTGVVLYAPLTYKA